MRGRAIGVGALLVATACSGSDPGSVSGSSTIAPAGTVAPGEQTTDPAPPVSDGEAATEQAPLSDSSVRIDATTPNGEGELVGSLGDSDDPFGRFVSCSGLRDHFATYSVLASGTAETADDVRSISVLSADVVGAPGTHDASVRVEFASAAAIDAVGTVTIASDFRSGSYVAFDLDGRKVDGTFDCAGPATPTPVAVGVADGVLETVEVFALLRAGEAQRVVGLAVDARSVSAECPGATEGERTSAVVRVVGDELTGAITEFVLTDGSPARIAMSVGAASYDFDGVQRGGVDTGLAGTFSAEAGGVTVDGAFRCS